MDLEKAAKKLGIGKPGHHIFLCCGKEEGGCCKKEEGLATWNYLKKRIDELNMQGKVHLYRTKVSCLRICTKGPIIVVYPEGIWYHSCIEPTINRILQEHILQGIIVQEFQIPPIC